MSLNNLDSDVETICLDELMEVLAGMKRGKATDDEGIIAEMLMDSSGSFLESVLGLFNDVLPLRMAVPAAWRATKLTVIFKKGDPRRVGNYRPIAILSVIYKLFSRIVCNRLMKFVIPAQGVEQAAYRKGFSTVDHLLTVTLVAQKSREFNVPVWMALVDYAKAFDTVEHEPLWNALLEQKVPMHYVVLLKRLYADQFASVQAGDRSRRFTVARGVKQGDPISALLFISVMQACFGELESKWEKANRRRTKTKIGIEVSFGQRCLTDLRFADDVVLFCQSRADIIKMLYHVKDVSSKFGLEINFDKTKVLTWVHLAAGVSSVQVGDQRVMVLAQSASERYLGRKLSLDDPHGAELDHRLAAGWAGFH